MNKKQVIIIIALIVVFAGIIALIISAYNEEVRLKEVSDEFHKNDTKLDENVIDENMKSKMKIFYEENKDKITVTEEDAELTAIEAVKNHYRKSAHDLISACRGNNPVLCVYEDSEGNLRLGYNVLVTGSYHEYSMSPTGNTDSDIQIYDYYYVDAIHGDIFFQYKHALNVSSLN